jgi:hypothetical protein
LNSLIHLTISVEKCFCLSANQVIVAYRPTKNDEHERYYIYGPGIFALKPDEWAHQFSWHGSEETNKTKYTADKNQFLILNCSPDQFYYNIDEVRTSDDALMRIKVMIFYELIDIDKMLKETKDPIADFLNCCTADVIAFTTKKTYLEFIENSYKLNDLAQYEKLVERSDKIGFKVTKVVFRGYYVSPTLEQMHNESIAKRTALTLNYESELQSEESNDINLKNEMNRLEAEQKLKLQQLMGEQHLERMKIEKNIEITLNQNKKTIEMEKEFKLKDIQVKMENNKAECQHLKKLKDLNVDLTKYLITSLNTPDKVVKIEKSNDAASTATSNIHFHNNN